MNYTQYPYLFHKYILNIATYIDNIEYKIIDSNNNLYNNIFDNTDYNIIGNLHCYNINEFNKFYSEYKTQLEYCELIIITFSIGNIKEQYTNIDLNTNYIFIQIHNKGLDIGSKFCCADFLNKHNITFKYIISLHSKSDNTRRHMYFDSLLNSLQTLSQDTNMNDDNTNNNILHNFHFIAPSIIWYGDRNNYTMNYNNIYLEDYYKYKNIDSKYYNDVEFVEGNCFIMTQWMLNYIFNDTKIYNILNTSNTFDYNWVNKYYNINSNDINQVYQYYKNNNLTPNNISNNGHQFRDCMIEHMFERLYLTILKAHNKQYLLINKSITLEYKSQLTNILNLETQLQNNLETETNLYSSIDNEIKQLNNHNNIEIIYNYEHTDYSLKNFTYFVNNITLGLNSSNIIISKIIIITSKTNENNNDFTKNIDKLNMYCNELDIYFTVNYYSSNNKYDTLLQYILTLGYENNNENENENENEIYTYINKQNICYLTSECVAFTNNNWANHFNNKLNSHDNSTHKYKNTVIVNCNEGPLSLCNTYFMFCNKKVFLDIYSNFFKDYLLCKFNDIYYEIKLSFNIFYKYNIYDLNKKEYLIHLYNPFKQYKKITYKHGESIFHNYNLEHNIKYTQEYIESLYVIKNIPVPEWYTKYIVDGNRFKLVKYHTVNIIDTYFKELLSNNNNLMSDKYKNYYITLYNKLTLIYNYKLDTNKFNISKAQHILFNKFPIEFSLTKLKNDKILNDYI